ncbi:unnamed protein product [Ectocarpus sp. CCAP 1310/34]|nr:unnamed protein product [Ectocarpus sp. CCAP 1310/34]
MEINDRYSGVLHSLCALCEDILFAPDHVEASSVLEHRDC